MSRPPPFARISLTIPQDLLRLADSIAKREGRSRSWVLSNAVAQMEDPVSAAPPRLDPSRRATLKSDLTLSPTQRVLAAERTAREVPQRRVGTLFVSFDRFEDYLEWKRRDAVTAP